LFKRRAAGTENRAVTVIIWPVFLDHASSEARVHLHLHLETRSWAPT